MNTESSTQTTLPSGYRIENGQLYLHGFNLASLAGYWLDHAGQDDAPLTIRYLPSVRDNLTKAREAFALASQQTGYAGQIRLAYASKANPNEAVIRAAIGSGADYECSSRVDAWIIRYAIEQGWLNKEQLIIANGFKIPSYADALIQLAVDGHTGIIPILDAAEEIEHFANSGIQLNMGLRYRVPGRGDRFGMDDAEILEAARLVSQTPNLTLTTFHAIQHYPAIDNPEHIASLSTAFEMFKKLRALYPSLAWFDVGGGLPAELKEADDLQEWMVSVQQLLIESCAGSPVPGLIIESGRYLAGAHQLEVFRVNRVKVIDNVPYYVLGGGIMSNLPDAWALGLEFPVFAVNNLTSPHRDVRLAGLTCDPDDVYPRNRDKFVSLPTDADGLMIAFMDIGAYQDMLGGEGGAKHCLLSEGATILIGDDPDYPTRVTYQPPQATESVLSHLGYNQERYSTF